MSFYDPAQVRAWARSAGHDVPERGRLAEKWEVLYFEAGAPVQTGPAEVQSSAPAISQDDPLGSVANVLGAVLRASLAEFRPRVITGVAYDPRPALFDADALAAARRWGIRSSREQYRVGDLDAMLCEVGEPELLPAGVSHRKELLATG